MSGHRLALPDGRRGQMLALGITAIGLVLVWVALILPLVGWYEARGAHLAEKQALAAHLLRFERELPVLRAAVAHLGITDTTAGMLLPGTSDAIAGANLQSNLQEIASAAGTSLDSAAMQPPKASGALRLISVQVSLTAPFQALIDFLVATATTEPRLIIDGITLTAIDAPGQSGPPSVQANLTVTGFRAEDQR